MTMKRVSSLVGVAAFLVVGAAWLTAGPSCADTIRNPTAIFAGLDKITGRIISFDVTVDETVQFGTLQITPRICLTRPQTEAPLTEGFVEVDEIDSAKQAKRVFSGWMFSASPGLHGVEHPVYDVWLKDCKGGVEVVATPAAGVDAPPPANASPAPKGAVPARKARTITPQNPVEPTVDDLGAPPPAPSDMPSLASPPSAPDDNGLGAPVEVGPAPGAGRAQTDGTLADPSQPVPPKPKPKPKRKPPPPVQPLDAPPAQAPQQERAPQQGFPNIIPKLF